MNVIIANQQANILGGLNIEVIKSIQGEYNVDDIINGFSNFFFSRMIIDVTALKDYENILTYQKLSIGLPVDKIILLIPSQTQVATNNFLSQLISMGFYNFTTNSDGIKYLLQNPNSYKDVAHLHQLNMPPPPVMQQPMVNNSIQNNEQNNNQNIVDNTPMMGGSFVLGIKNVTPNAGATSLTYMMYNELVKHQRINTLAVEVGKKDFQYFNDSNMMSTTKQELAGVLMRNQSYSVILVDLNDTDTDVCTDIIYLIEPSILKMNKLMKTNRMYFNKIRDQKMILNRCVLSKSDIREFEKELGSRLFYVLPPMDDRTRQESVIRLLEAIGLIGRKRR